jgi:uncharacterized protein YdaU (DUF1376 family)
MKAKSPAFQFYAAEFLADENVVLMSNQEIGCYIKLLCYCWREGSIPSDVNKIARLCGEDSSAMDQLWLAIRQCFESAFDDETRLINPRLVAERVKQEEHRKERAESGAKGAKARWEAAHKADSSANGSAKKQPKAKHASSSSTLSSSSNKNTYVYEDYPEFMEFWSLYPNKDGKYKALEAWAKANPKPPIEPILHALCWQTRSDKWLKDGGQFVPLAATYINGKRWQDEQPQEVTF